MRRAITKHARDFGFIVGMVVVAAVIAGYILSNERLRFPWQSSPIKMYANFSTAQAVTPGQGQTVRVSGVQVGTIDSVKLQDGYAQVAMGIDPKYKSLIHPDATALLRPKTGLKDMFIELNPGHKGPAVKAGFTIPIQNTLPDVNPDEVLSSLDADTRDYLRLLVSGFGEGLYGRGSDLNQVLGRFLPTSRDIARINGLLARRHANLSHVINSLNLLNTALAQRAPQITQLVSDSAQVFNGFATEQANIQSSLAAFPSTLRETTQTLTKLTPFANLLGQTTQNLIPVGHAIPPANRAIIPFAQTATPIIANQIRPYVISSRPLVRALQPASVNLAKATPDLTTSFTVLNHLFNLIGLNPSGPNASVTDPNRDEGYLFWIAWLEHNGASVFGDSDANGVYRALTQEGTCASLDAEAGNIQTPLGQAQGQLLGTLGVLLNPTLCGPNGIGGNLLSALNGLPTLPSFPPLPPPPAGLPGLPPLPANRSSQTASGKASPTNILNPSYAGRGLVGNTLPAAGSKAAKTLAAAANKGGNG